MTTATRNGSFPFPPGVVPEAAVASADSWMGPSVNSCGTPSLWLTSAKHSGPTISTQPSSSGKYRCSFMDEIVSDSAADAGTQEVGLGHFACLVGREPLTGLLPMLGEVGSVPPSERDAAVAALPQHPGLAHRSQCGEQPPNAQTQYRAKAMTSSMTSTMGSSTTGRSGTDRPTPRAGRGRGPSPIGLQTVAARAPSPHPPTTRCRCSHARSAGACQRRRSRSTAP